VRQISRTRDDGGRRKIPHIGWNGLSLPARRNGWAGTILDGLPDGASAYFLHSYAVLPVDDAVRLAESDYDDVRLCAAVQRGLVYGCQFHPEKSGEVGLAILRNFLAL
jgi:imidazole glycerol-phosphate synthase subunit HisH